MNGIVIRFVLLAVMLAVMLVVVANQPIAAPIVAESSSKNSPIPPAELATTTIWLAVTADYKGLLTNARPGRAGTRGWAHLSAFLETLEQANRNELVLLDAGDALLGAFSSILPQEANLSEQAYRTPPALTVMNKLGWHAMAVGNYDLNIQHLTRAEQDSNFAWLAANATKIKAKEDLVFRPYLIVQRGTVRIGILGFGQPALRFAKTEQQDAWQMADILRSSGYWVPYLREREKVDLVIALMHSGADPFYGWEQAATYNQPLPSVAGLVAWHWQLPPHARPDLVLSGGAHRMSYPPRPYHRLHWQTPTQPSPLLEVGSSGRAIMLVRMRLQANTSLQTETSWQANPKPSLQTETSGQARPTPSLQATPSPQTETSWQANPTPSPQANTSLQTETSWQPISLKAAAVKLPVLSLNEALAQLPLPAKQSWQAAQQSLDQASTWYFATSKLPKRDRRPLARCLAELQHQALKGYLQKSTDPFFSLLPLPAGIHAQPLPHGEPIQRRHIYRWLRYPDQLVQIKAKAKQMAILLTGWLRWQNNYSTRGLSTLYPGGLVLHTKTRKNQAGKKSKSSDIKALLPHNQDVPLRWRKSYPIWTTKFISKGYNPIAKLALLNEPPAQQQLNISLRELLFQSLQAERVPPKKCRRFFTNKQAK